MGYFKHGHIQCKYLESTGGEDQQFIFLIQESFEADIVIATSATKLPGKTTGFTVLKSHEFRTKLSATNL